MHDSTEPAIERMARFCLDRSTWLLIALAVLGAALVLARQVAYGVGLHWDSINYIGVARNLLAGEGFIQIGGNPYAWWPPLYPLLLAVAGLGVFDPHDVAGPLNAVIFGLTVLVAGRYLRRRLESRFLALWGGLAVMLSIPLAQTASWALSEPAFILLTLLALIQTDAFLSEGKRSTLLWAAVFTALACLTRFMGVALLAAVVLLLIFQRGLAWLERLKRITAYVLIAAAPMCLWMLRTFLITGQPTGGRGFSGQSLPEVMVQIAKAFAQWVFHDLPSRDVLSIAAKLAAGPALLALAIAAGYVLVHWRHLTRKTWTDGPLLITFGGFALAYMAALVAAAMLGAIEHGIQSRYVDPLYIPLLFLALCLMDHFLHRAWEKKAVKAAGGLPMIAAWAKWKAGWPAILMTTLSLWLGWQVALNARAIERANNGIDLGYASARFADSEVLQYIRENAIEGFIFGNAVYPVYIHTNGTAIFRYTGQHWIRRWSERVVDGSHIVWFYDVYVNNRLDYGAPDLRGLPKLKTVTELSDGVIFKVDQSAGDDGNPYRSMYEAAVSGKPVSRSNFDVYVDGHALTYIREPCNLADMKPKLFLHLFPAEAHDLPEPRKRYGFDNYDFFFNRHGVRFDGKCMATIRLPEHAIARIRTGQFVSGEGPLWKAEFPLHWEEG